MIITVRFARGGFMQIIDIVSPGLRDLYLRAIHNH
jgi:hypothetical protein